MASAAAQSEVLPAATTASELFISAAAAEPESSEFFEEKVVDANGKGCSFSSQRCDCCPYGYHIDLDFLQFLNSLYDVESLKKLKRFKRGSNALLSSVASSDDCLCSAFSLNLERTRETENVVLIADGDDVSPHQTLDEFDASLCRTTAFSPNRLVLQQKHCKQQSTAKQLSDAATDEATALELSLCLTTSDESIDGCSTSETNAEQLLKSAVPPPPERHGADASTSKESSVSLGEVFSVEDGGWMSPTFLLAIREQLVLSLRRTKELEEQVKVIPILKSHISMLKEENSLLTLTPDRTFSNAAVGDFPVFDDAGPSKAEIPQSTGGRETVETSELISNNSDFEGKNSTECFSTVSLKSTSHPISSLPLDYSNFKTVYCCVGVSDVAKTEEDSKKVGILSQATTSDSCVGSDVDFVDCGTGDEIVLYHDDDDDHHHHTFNKLTKQPQSPSETAADLESRSTRNGNGKNPPNGSLVLSKIVNFDELESPTTSSVGDAKRFQSVATQCEDGDKKGRNDSIENSDFQPTLSLSISSVQHLSNSRATQTDKFLIVEYSSKTVKIGDDETVPSVDDRPAVNVVKSTETSKKRISFGEVTIFETEISDDDDDDDGGLIIDEDTSSTDCETDTGLHNGAEDPGNHQLPSHVQKTQASTTVESADQSPVVECIVTEGVLESPQCGLSVIIDDSSGESSTATSSDSEDSSALTILEVIPVNGKSPSISMAVKSVDEYFDAGVVAAEEHSTVDDDDGGSGENLAVDGKDDEVVLVIDETSSLPTTKEDAENADKLPGKNILSFNFDGQTETNQCNQHSIKSLANSASDESSVNCKTDSESFISFSSPSPSKRKTCDERINLYSEAVNEVTVDYFSRSVFPVTDHLEVIQVQKKHQKNPGVISLIEPQVTGIPSVAKDEIKSRSQMSSSDDAMSNDHPELLNYGHIVESSVTKKKIVITETLIERRRIDKSPFDDQTQSTEDRSFGSEDLKDDDDDDDDHSRSENDAEYIDKSEGEIAVMAAPEVTKQTPEDISNSNHDKSTVAGQTGQSFPQPGKTDSSDRNDLTEIDVERESSENFSEDHNGTCLNAEMQLDGDISEAMAIYNRWLQSPEETRLEKVPLLEESVRKHWFGVCGRKTSSATDIKTFLSLASSYSDALLQRIVNMADSDGNTALHYAVSYSNTDTIRRLLDTGCCDVNRQNKAGYTAIMLAALLLLVDSDRNRSVIERLFQLGNVNIPSSLSGQTALMLAASHGHNVTVQTLLTIGADVNAQDEDGSTALMCASEHGHVDVIRTLLGHSRCDSTLADVDGSTALSIAMEEGHQEIGVLIYAHMKAFRASQERSGAADEAGGT